MASYAREIFTTKEGKDFEVRALQAADAFSLINFLQQAATETTHTNQYIGRVFPPAEEFGKKIQAVFADPRALHIGAFDQSTLVAMINLRPLNSDHR